MTTSFKPLRRFTGREIGPAIVACIEALPADAEIVEFKAGENMPITVAHTNDAYYESNAGLIPEYAWDGETLREIGYL